MKTLAPKPKVCASSGPIDIGFTLDSSGSMRKADFNKMKKAVVDLIGMFEVSKKGLHVGVIRFQTKAFLEFDFANAANSNKKALIAAVEKVKVGTLFDLVDSYTQAEVFFLLQEMFLIKYILFS